MNSVSITRMFNVSKTAIWEAWTHPAQVLQWFGSDPAGDGLTASIDLRVGGRYTVTFRDSNGTEHTCSGAYEQVIHEKELQFTWEWASEPGHVSRVRVLLSANADGTTMDFQHYDLNPNSLHGYEEGWNRTFDKLSQLLRF